MSGFKKVITTNKGKNILASLLAEEKTIKFSKICTSNKIYEDAEIQEITNLENIKQTIPVSSKSIENNSTVKITATINNLELIEDYNICSIGVFLEYDNTECLYALMTVDNEDNSIFMPKKNDNVITKFDISLLTIISNADSAKFEINPTGFAAKDDVYNKIEIDNKLNNNLLKTYSLTLLLANWVLNETTGRYEYNVINQNITSQHYVSIDPASFEDKEKCSSGIGETYDGGFKLEVTELPESDINVVVSYQLATDVTPAPTEQETLITPETPEVVE